MKFVKTVQVLENIKVSTSLKMQAFYYVANTPNYFLKVLTNSTSSILLLMEHQTYTP